MKKTFFIISFTVLLVIISLPSNVLAIAQLTKPIIINDVMKGQEFTETVTLFNAKEVVDTYGLEGSGDVEEWLSFYATGDVSFESPITQVDVPAKSYQNAIVKINVPSDIPNGEYIGQVLVVSIPEESDEVGTTTVQVRQKVGREIIVTVTDEDIVDARTAIIPVSYDMDEGVELVINLKYENEGNVLVKPSVGLQIVNTEGGSTVFDAVFLYPVDEEPVGAKTTKVIPIKWQTTGQPNGRYEARIKVIVGEDIVQEDDFRFNLGLSKGVQEGSFGISIVSILGGGNLVLGWFIIGIVLLIIAGVLIIIKKRRN